MNAASGQDAPPDHLVFVVHGVGDPKPADALTSLVDSYCVQARATPTGPRVSSALTDEEDPGLTASARGPGGAPPDPFIRTFPVNRIDTVRTAADGATERTRFVEVYWGDLSRVKGSAGGLLLGIVDLVFGLRHVVKAARLEIDSLGLPWWIKQPAAWAGEAASASQSLMRGPLLALNLLAAVVVVLFLMDAATRLPLTRAEADATLAGVDRVRQAFGPCVGLANDPERWIAAEARLAPDAVYCTGGGLGLPISGVVALVLGFVLLLLALARGWSIAMAAWLCVAGIAGLAWWAASVHLPGGVPTYARFIEDLTAVLSLGAAMVGLLVVGMLLLSLLAWILALASNPASARPLRRALTVVNVCTTLSTALFVLLLMVVWAALSRQIEIPVLSQRIEGGLHLFVVVWLTFVLIGLAYGSIVYRAWRRKCERERGADEVVFPRYIVGFEAVTAVIVSALLWPLVFVPTVVGLECNDGQRVWSALGICDALGTRSSTFSGWILEKAHAIDGFVSLAIMASIGAVILLFAARAHCGAALDIVLDVVSHFSLSTPPVKPGAVGRAIAQRAWALLPTRLERLLRPGAAAATVEHAIWHTIVRRFCAVLDRELAASPAPRVTVLAHSQGTMIALEGLGLIRIDRKGTFPDLEHTVRLPPAVGTVQLVTLGCPLAHLYMHYFPEQYTFAQPAPRRLTRWLNVYRADDFVGRCIGEAKGTHPKNIEVAPRGHVNYWADREVLEHLVDRQQVL